MASEVTEGNHAKASKKSKKDNISIDKTLTDLGIKQECMQSNINTSDRVTQTSSEYEYYLYCKHQLEILIASGKCKDFLNKNITFQDLDTMKPEQIIKSFKIYEAARTARINDAISETVVKGYSKLCNHLIPIEDEDKLYNDLKGDYLVMTELNKWVGFLSFRLGGLMTLFSTGVITFSNIKPLNKNLPIINGRGEGDASNKKTEIC